MYGRLPGLAGRLPAAQRTSEHSDHGCSTPMGSLAGWQPGICAGKSRSPSCFPAALLASREMSRQGALEGCTVFASGSRALWQQGSRVGAGVVHHRIAKSTGTCQLAGGFLRRMWFAVDSMKIDSSQCIDPVKATRLARQRGSRPLHSTARLLLS